MAQDITSVNAVLLLSAPGVWSGPQQIQGFSTDNIFEADALDVAEVLMGLDGGLSAGFIYKEQSIGYTLQAGSPSIPLFDALYVQSKQTQSIYWLSGSITLNSINMKYALVNGVLKTYPAVSSGGKVLSPRKFTIVWESISPAATN